MPTYQRRWASDSHSSRSEYFNQKRRLLFGSGQSHNFRFNRGGKKSRSFKFSRLFRGGSIFKLVGILAVLFLVLGLSAFAYFSKDMPDPNKLTARVVPESTKIFDRNGELLYNIFGEAKRTLISFEDMPKNVKDATVAIEDKNFYNHGGVDFIRIITSSIIDVVTFSKARGASTITQQFIRNALLTREKSYARKIKEIVLAIQIERKYSKDEILKMYLNEVPYGNNAYGIQAAAQTYFNKNAKDLTLAEAAYLAALPQSPTYLSPYGPNRDRLDARKNTVLEVMKDQGYISEEQKKSAQAEKVNFVSVRNAIQAPHFVMYVEDLLAQKYGEKTLQEGGLQVTTTLDLKMQKMAEEAVAAYAEKNETKYNAKNEALVALDPKTGQVLAMVGSRNYFDDAIDGQVNVALRPRQPGSSFKPYVYATAFKKGYAPASLIMDVETNFGQFGGIDYAPHNYDGKVNGPVSMRQALAGSLNIPAVKTILLVGVKDSIETAHDLGISTLKDESAYGPSLVLGGGEVSLLDHVSAFGVFANGGLRKPTVPILKVTDSHGNVLEENKEKTGQQVLDSQVAYLITSILSDNNARAFIFGPQNYLTLPDRPVAAKTGTTQEYHDGWTVGYTPQLAAGVWAGNSDNSAMNGKADGSAIAAPIWNYFMKKALAGQPVEQFSRPEGIRDLAVDKLSGKLPTQYSPETKPEVFASFGLPQQYDDVHVPVKIDKNTGRPATGDTPQDNVIIKIYTVLHSEKPDDPAWEDPVRAWALSHGYTYPEEQVGENNNPVTSVTITKPNESEIITSSPVPIVTSVAGGTVKKLQIFFDGEGIFSADSGSLTYFYSSPQPDGSHTIRVTAETADGKTWETTRQIVYQTGADAAITSPSNNDRVTFPLTLEARINQQAGDQEFYYRDSQGAITKISGTVQSSPDGIYANLKIKWATKEKPKAGSYEIYCQNGAGKKSPVVKITVP
jgi:1A family penicillin-binding protein